MSYNIRYIFTIKNEYKYRIIQGLSSIIYHQIWIIDMDEFPQSWGYPQKRWMFYWKIPLKCMRTTGASVSTWGSTINWWISLAHPQYGGTMVIQSFTNFNWRKKHLPSGHLTYNSHGKSPCLIGTQSISMGHFPWLCNK